MEHVYQTGIPLKEGRIFKLMLCVCKALEAMHTCSAGPYVHNDVKVRKSGTSLPLRCVICIQPGNLLISDDGKQLILMDLGSARDAEVVIANR